jgi:hypothetical protein
MKPQDFLIGIRDFFAILVPGAVVVMLMPGVIGLAQSATESFRFVALAIAAFLVGSIADRLGALLDYAVDPIIKSKWVRGITKRTNAREAEAEGCRDQLLAMCEPALPLDRQEPVSCRAFWWNHLRLTCPVGIQELDRIEGAQKLFRSLAAAFLFLGIYYGFGGAQPDWFPAGAIDAPWLMLLCAAISTILFGAGRFAFRATVFRLAVAYCIQQRSSQGVGRKRDSSLTAVSPRTAPVP